MIYICQYFGNRLVVLVGIVISSSAFALTYLATDVWYLLISHGVCNGLGAVLTINPPFFIVGEYFPYDHPRYVCATCIIVSGFPLGKIYLFVYCQQLKQFHITGALVL